MKNKILMILCTAAISCVWVTGCSGSDSQEPEGTVTETADEAKNTETPEKASDLEDGLYQAEFDTDSSMFHVNESCDGKGTLTVKDGEMVIHVSLASKNIVNLYYGLAEDAQKDGAKLIDLQMTLSLTATALRRRYTALTFRFLRWMKNMTLL